MRKSRQAHKTPKAGTARARHRSTLDDSARVARTEYQYDQQSGTQLTNTAGVVQHERASDPHNPSDTECEYVWNGDYHEWVCTTTTFYDAGTDKRGNVTNVKRFADAPNYGSDPIPLTETRAYDICGNVRTASTSCCEQTSFDYTSTTQYA